MASKDKKETTETEKTTKVNPKDTSDLGLLEEDDDFEEFPAEEWTAKDEDKEDVNVWEDNWDDDAVEDDFSVQLSKNSRKRPHSPPLRSPEPLAKKLCTRVAVAPEAEAMDTHTNGNGTSNGHTNGNSHSNSQSNGRGGRSTRGGRSSRSSRSNADSAASNSEAASSSPAPASPARSTRSSARLRSSRK